MSVQHPDADRQRLLPATAEHSLNELGIRICGGALVACAAISWLSLLSWQQSAAGTAGKSVRNLLGSFGAGLSDMMVHTLGVAVVFALICPMVWGLELLAGVRWIARFKLKVVAATGAVLALAGVASGLPPVPGWPLLGGSGGMLGDLVHNLMLSAARHVGLERSGSLALVATAMLGVVMLARSLGVGAGVLAQLAGGSRHVRSAQQPPTVVAPPPVAAAAPDLDGERVRVRVKARSTGARTEGADAAATPAPGVGAHAMPAPEGAPRVLTAHDPAIETPAFLRRRQVASPEQPRPRAIPPPAPAGPIETLADDEHADHEADAARAFAERFAPGVAAGRPKERKRISTALASTIARARPEPTFRKPSLNLLRRGAPPPGLAMDVETGASALLAALSQFGVRGEIRAAHPGPVVTRYELAPAPGTQVSRVMGLADDFARELGVAAIRASLVQGRNTIAIEVPNVCRETIALRDILECDTYTAHPMALPLALGKGVGGEPVVLDLARMPHLLIAGAGGAGKTVGLDAVLLSLLYRLEPSELRLMMIAPRTLELTHYDRIPHLLTPVIGDVSEAVRALEWAVTEMEERYRRMAQQSTRNIEAFNAKVRAARTAGTPLTRTVQTGFDSATGRAIYERQQIDDQPMTYIVIVVDELADLMVGAGRRIEGLVHKLAQRSRAAGIHLIVATARPSTDIVTGPIRASLPVRICYRLASKIDSRTLLAEPGAEQLLGQGDMLLSSGAGPGQHLRVHGAHVSAEEAQRVAEALREQGEPQYVALLHGSAFGGEPAIPGNTGAAAETRYAEEMYAAAVSVVAGDRKVSPGHLHRRLGIAEDIAEQLIERMEQEGLVGPVNMLRRRAILMRPPARSARSAA